VTHIVITRPERTRDEIAADAAQADAFYKQFDGYQNQSSSRWRDVRRRVIERESLHYTLLLALKESQEWTAERAETRSVRTARAFANELARNPIHWMHRRNQNLRPYVQQWAQRALPTPRVRRRNSTKQRLATIAWFSNLSRWSERRIARAEADLSSSFEQWRARPEWRHYGPNNPAPAGWAPARPRVTKTSQLAIARASNQPPVSQARQLDIALRALESRSGQW